MRWLLIWMSRWMFHKCLVFQVDLASVLCIVFFLLQIDLFSYWHYIIYRCSIENKVDPPLIINTSFFIIGLSSYVDPAAVASQKAQQQSQQQQGQAQAQQTAQGQQSQIGGQQQGTETAGSIKATEPMWRCSRIMHMQKELHPTVLASLEGIVDQVILYTKPSIHSLPSRTSLL